MLTDRGVPVKISASLLLSCMTLEKKALLTVKQLETESSTHPGLRLYDEARRLCSMVSVQSL